MSNLLNLYGEIINVLHAELKLNQGFPFENFGGGTRFPPTLASRGGEYAPIFGGVGKHNFTNFKGKNT